MNNAIMIKIDDTFFFSNQQHYNFSNNLLSLKLIDLDFAALMLPSQNLSPLHPMLNASCLCRMLQLLQKISGRFSVFPTFIILKKPLHIVPICKTNINFNETTTFSLVIAVLTPKNKLLLIKQQLEL